MFRLRSAKPLTLTHVDSAAFVSISFGLMSPSAICHMRVNVVWLNVAFGLMSHSAICRIQLYVVRLNVVRLNVVRHTVGVSFNSMTSVLYSFRRKDVQNCEKKQNNLNFYKRNFEKKFKKEGKIY